MELELNENNEGVEVCKACGHPPECHIDGHIRLGFPCECVLKKVVA